MKVAGLYPLNQQKPKANRRPIGKPAEFVQICGKNLCKKRLE